MEYLKNLVKDIFVFIYALIKWLIMLFLSGWVMAFLLMIFIASLWYPLIVLSPMLTSFSDLFSAFGVFFKSFYNSLFVVFDKLFEAKYWGIPNIIIFIPSCIYIVWFSNSFGDDGVR